MLPKFYYYSIALIGLLLSLMSERTMAQIDGPGGVGASSNLTLWLRAEDIVTNPPQGGLGAANLWPDVFNSINSRVAQFNGNFTYEVDSLINYNYAVVFNDEYFESNLDISTDKLNVFIVYRLETPPNQQPLWGNGQGVNHRYLKTDSVHLGGNVSQHYLGGDTPEATISNVEIDGDSSLASYLFVNSSTPSSNFTVSGTNNAGTPFFIGTTQGQLPFIDSLDGLVAEVIVYNATLSPTNRERITSYLAIKYGITLPDNYFLSNGVRIWDNSAGYNNNIAGIAHDEDSGLNQVRSRSQANNAALIVEYTGGSTPTTIPDKHALVWGNDGAAINTTTTFQASDNFFAQGERLSRVWRVERTLNANNPASFDDFSLYIDRANLPANFTAGNVFVLVADDAAFQTNLRAFPITNITAQQFGTDDIEFETGEQYMTLAIGNTALWGKADGSDNVTNGGGNRLEELEDYAFHMNKMTASGGNRPEFFEATVNDALNFNPYIRFNDGSSNDYIERTGLIGFGNSPASIFMVLRREPDGNISVDPEETLISYATTGANIGNDFLLYDPEDVKVAVNDPIFSASRASGFDITNNRPKILSVIRGGNANTDFLLDGSLSVQSGAHENGTVIPSGGTLIIGQEQDIPGGQFDAHQVYRGDLGEVIIFSNRVSAPDRVKIESYLAVKYGISLATTNNYVASDGSIIWDVTTNATHLNNVTGIGRDDVFELMQVRSKNQSNDPADIKVEIQASNPITQDLSHLIWGHDGVAHDSVLPITASPIGFKRFGRTWKVQNNGDRVGDVDVSIKLPAGVPRPTSIQLLVSNQANMLNALIYDGSYNSATGITRFDNVELNDGDYFALGEEGPFLVNRNKPEINFEACVGDTIEIYYSNFSAHPFLLDLTNTSSNTIVNALNILSPSILPNGDHRGIAQFVIPLSAFTGNVEILGGGMLLHDFAQNLVIQNPPVSFSPITSPVCATDPVLLVGVPSGGTFSTLLPANSALLSGDTLLADYDAIWPISVDPITSRSYTDSVISPFITYSYFPEYSDGTLCARSTDVSARVDIVNNRLNQLTLSGIFGQNTPLNATDRTYLDSLIRPFSIIPPLPQNINPYLDFTYVGTYVADSTSLGDSTRKHFFLSDLAGVGAKPVTMTYENGGCLATYIADVNVIPELTIGGLSKENRDTLCDGAAPFFFFRDTVFSFRDTSYLILGEPGLDSTRERLFELLSAQTRDITQQGAISVINNTRNNEQFTLDPSLLVGNPSFVVIDLLYRNTSQAYFTTGTVIRDTLNFTISDTIFLVSPPSFGLQGVQPFYCYDAPADTITLNPAYSFLDRTNLRLIFEDSLGNLVINDTLLYERDSITGQLVTTFFLDASYHYDKHVPANNRDLDARITYTINYFGCLGADTAFTRILAPIFPIFDADTFCSEEPSTLLSIGFTPNSFIRGGAPSMSRNFTSLPSIDTSVRHFSLDSVTGRFYPSLAPVTNHPVTYTFTDLFGCQYAYTDTLYVRETPDVQLEADNSGAVNTVFFCASDTFKLLTTTILSGNINGTYTYLGPGVIADSLDPSDMFAGGSGTADISVRYTDLFGCVGRDTLTVSVRPLPNLTFSGINNPAEYCANDPAFRITATPAFSTGSTNTSGVPSGMTGTGITFINNEYFYNPALIDSLGSIDSFVIDTVSFLYTDNIGCSQESFFTIRIDSLPEMGLTGVTNLYCVNNAPSQLLGIPSSATSLGTGVYGGPSGSVNPNTGFIDPSLAGTGEKIVSYTFTDNNGCSNSIRDTIFINTPPSLSYGGISAPYCSSDQPDTLFSNNFVGPGTSFSFSGVVIVMDSILDPSLAPSTGVTEVFYTYTDTIGCSNVDSFDVYIASIPVINLNGLDSAYCSGGAVDIIGIYPSGGFLDTAAASNGFLLAPPNLRFDPGTDPAGGMQAFTYTFIDAGSGCVSVLTDSVYVYPSVSVNFSSNLDSAYCMIQNPIPLQGNPGGGYFTGAGVSGNIFNPANASAGIQFINYIIDTTIISGSDTLVCSNTATRSVLIKSIPQIGMITPSNFNTFCSNDTAAHLIPTVGPNEDYIFTSPDSGVIVPRVRVDTTLGPGPNQITLTFDSAYSFAPIQIGTNLVSYIVSDSITGCSNTFVLNYEVDEYADAAIATLDTQYCITGDSIPLFADPPGGTFTRDGNLIPTTAAFFSLTNSSPIPLSYPDSIVDTVIYEVNFGACYSADTLLVTLHSVPVLSFTDSIANNSRYCLGSDTIQLYPNISGGEFRGTGVPFDSTIFIPRTAGTYPIWYSYTDPFSGCSATVADTFSVFGQPNIEFAIIGGCEQDSLVFAPNNQILGLDNIFNNSLVDQITSITWDFGNNVILNGSSQVVNDTIQIDDINYAYPSSGVYFAILTVVNQGFCTDSDTVRLVVSPNVDSTQFPYIQDFENANHLWLAENRTNTGNLLWEWGSDNNNQGIPAGPNNFWATKLNSRYDQDEDGWVYSPCFDIDTLIRPMLKFDRWSDTRAGVDGAILEYKNANGRWVPLGRPNRGINWFQPGIIAGRPGDQTLAPVGWSGQDNQWVNSRYKLDSLDLPDGILRLRFAFASPSVPLATFYDGFAFDNFWIGERTRNVLLETTSNINQAGMPTINRHVYDLVFHSGINRDVILLQYNSEQPNPSDEFHLDNTAVANSRTLYYSMTGTAGQAAINGQTAGIPASINLRSTDFENDMLESPKFDIRIDTFMHTAQVVMIEATVEALEDLPLNTYRINTVITEDSLVYSNVNGDEVHAVVRADDESNIQNLATRAWSVGDQMQVTFTWNHGASPNNYLHENFEAVVFIQVQDSTKKVFQAVTERDVSGYWTGIEPVEAAANLKTVSSLKVFPNPAGQYFEVQFDEPLEGDYQWRLIDLRGVEILGGEMTQGTQQMTVQNYDLVPGMYILVVNNDKVFAKRKLIIQP